MKRSISFDAEVHGTFRDTEKKRNLTGQMDIPINTKLKSQICARSESTEETEDTDFSSHNPVIQNKAGSQTRWIPDTHESLEHLTWKEQKVNSHLDKDICIEQHEKKETEKTVSLLSQTHAPREGPIWKDSRNITVRTATSEEPMFDHDCHLKEHEQNESEKTTSLLSNTGCEVPTMTRNADQYNICSPTRNITARTKTKEEPIFDYDVTLCRLREMTRKRRPKLLGSQLVHVKHKQTQTEKTTSLLSQTHAAREGPSWKDSRNITVRTATSEEPMFDHDCHLKEHEQNESEKTTSLLSQTHAPWDVPTCMHNTDQYNMYNPTRNRTARTELRLRPISSFWSRQDALQQYKTKRKQSEKTTKTELLVGSHLVPHVKNKQKESEKATSFLSNTGCEVPTMTCNADQYNIYSPTRNITARTKTKEEPIFDYGVTPCRLREMTRKRRPKLLGSQLVHVKHKQTQTETTASFLSDTRAPWELPTWEQNTDSYNLHNSSKNLTARTKTVANILSPGDGLELTHNRSISKPSHSKHHHFTSCSHSTTSFVDDSAAGSSIANFNSQSEETVKHNNMESETMSDDDYKLPGKSAPLSVYPLLKFSRDPSGPWNTSCFLPCSHGMVSLSKIPHAKNNFTQVDTLLKEFTPVITDDFDDETYRFQCSGPGLYECSVTGLVFVMKGEGDVVYRTVPWNRRLLAQHHKKPAGPLFDIKCLQQSVCQLHLPHCEIISTGGGRFLQVAHVNDEGIEFITPHQITETHVVINITGFSGYGNVKDEESPPDPVQALVLLFYKPPDPDLRSIISVLLLPRNIVIRDVQRTRRKLIGDERYIDTSPHCKLHPKQVYTLSTAPEDDLIKVQPKETDFDDEYHSSYFTSYQVILKRIITGINLSLTDKSSSSCVWEREVCLFSPTVGTMNCPSSQRLLNTRSCFIEGISRPVLNSLIDKLLEKKVITDAEREEADTKQNKREKACFVIDTVRNKGDVASSEMIEFLRENDHFLCEHLGLN